MNARIVAVIAVLVAAVAVVGVKQARARPQSNRVEATVAPRATTPSVVLVADPREAGTDCGCGLIIRRVREAKARGVSVVELAPTDPGVARYSVSVAPTVLGLGGDGRGVARREGESSETLAAISSDLAALEGRKR